MKQGWILGTLSVFLGITLMGCQTTGGLGETNETKQTRVTMERIDQSIRTEEGAVLAEVYYEKPVLSGNSEVARSINSFFNEESEGWVQGNNRLTPFEDNPVNDFLVEVEDLIPYIQEDVLAEQPFLYTVDTEIMLFDEKTLSIM
jgi:hypothetical protein